MSVQGKDAIKAKEINYGSVARFIKGIISSGDDSVIEHVPISIRVICDRGVTHEIVRRRVASYSQGCTWCCNYTTDKFVNEVTVIHPLFWKEGSIQFDVWKKQMEYAEEAYFSLINADSSPQEARTVLPILLNFN